MYNSVIFSKIRVVQSSPQSSFRTFPLPQRIPLGWGLSPVTLHSTQWLPQLSAPNKQESTSCLSCLPILYISCNKWDRVTCVRFFWDDRGWDGWMASLTQWTWVWVNSGSCWWTGRPGVLRFMGLQRVGHDWATELTDSLRLMCLRFLRAVVCISTAFFIA